MSEQDNEYLDKDAGKDADKGPGEKQGEENEARKLNSEDQERVDRFLKRGVNAVERKPFRPILLLIMLIVVVAGLSLLSQWLAQEAGVY